MTTEERKILATQPITWIGDLSDDCTANWAGLMLRGEWMDEDYWWWAVYDMKKDGGGEISRQKAESVAQEYINRITTRQETAKYIIADTFKISGRGLVFAGYITEGFVSIGDTVEFIVFSTLYQRRIIGIEGITKPQPDKINTGLLIECYNDVEIDELRNWRPDNVVAVIYASSAHPLG
ncbi:hypothetical protein [Sporocytophaga myxococcoides]|uniref:hypothetical protein n=1 Tax=Sporocytophaga myxococcoides TaxID=153721 RepID=UPI00041E3FE9|nr:hypothetical protein [Sporocytophaga myxococcoides]